MTSRFTVLFMAMGLPVVLGGVTSTEIARADDLFKIIPIQRIACTRAPLPGKQQAISCKSYAYVMNSSTSEFYRCQVSVAVTRDTKTILKTDASGSCALKVRVFPTDSHYGFDATETEPPSTNTFFGAGGSSIWVADATKRNVKGCIGLAMNAAPDVLKCVDMTFDN